MGQVHYQTMHVSIRSQDISVHHLECKLGKVCCLVYVYVPSSTHDLCMIGKRESLSRGEDTLTV